MEAGLDPVGFWGLSVAEYEAVLDGAERRLAREHNANAWLAWHVAALMRHDKRLPSLESLQAKPKSRDQQTWQQQKSMAVMLTHLYGGTVH